MAEIKEMERRLSSALSRIEKASKALAKRPAAAVADAKAEELEAEVKTLRGQLGDVRDARKRDLDEMDAILAQLRPLIEER
jgi:seryl-tRNA synthetase